MGVGIDCNILLEEYIDNLRKQNKVLCEISEFLMKQQKLAQQDRMDDLLELFEKINNLIKIKEGLNKEADKLSKKITEVVGIDKFDQRVLENIPHNYVSSLLTEYNKMRINLERGNQITFENEFLLKKR